MPTGAETTVTLRQRYALEAVIAASRTLTGPQIRQILAGETADPLVAGAFALADRMISFENTNGAGIAEADLIWRIAPANLNVGEALPTDTFASQAAALAAAQAAATAGARDYVVMVSYLEASAP